MVSNLLIREAGWDDVDVIVEFNARIALETEHKSLALDTLRKGVGALVNDPARGRYFLACTPQRVVGQLMITTEWSDWLDGTWWWIQSVYVHPDYRNRGVFRALYEHVEQQAGRQTEVIGVRLYVHRDNAAAQKVYQQLGLRNAGYIVFERKAVGAPE
jgi:GNAT superfamily N-acetyltransferase